MEATLKPIAAPPAAPTDTCPRCGQGFCCGVADCTRPCDCTRVQLSANLQTELRRRYIGCLCLDCLRSIADGPPEGPRAPR